MLWRRTNVGEGGVQLGQRGCVARVSRNHLRIREQALFHVMHDTDKPTVRKKLGLLCG
jgi:hypothetical protein